MFSPDEWVPISAIEHYSYCPRQYALIHLEDVYHENVFTLRGRRLHEQAHASGGSTEEGVRVERALPIWSERFGLTGVADVVEFWPDGEVYPVEYKAGSARRGRHADLQLCAQALCLEEMLGVPVPRGAIYSGASRRRREVVLDDALRRETLRVVEAIRETQREGRLPPPLNDRHCPNCSLVDACVPDAVAAAARRRARDIWKLATEDEP